MSYIAHMESQADYRLTPPAETVLFPAGAWTESLERNRQQLQLDYFAMKQRAEKAEARVKEQQAELSEQEVDKLTLLRELREARAALHNATR